MEERTKDEGRRRARRGAAVVAAVGGMVAIIVTPGLTQSRSTRAPVATIETRLKNLESRLKSTEAKLKNSETRLRAAEGALSSLTAKIAPSGGAGLRLHAPLEVVDQAGKALARVEKDGSGSCLRLFNRDGKDTIWACTNATGGQISVLDSAGDYSAALSAGTLGGRVSAISAGNGTASLRADERGSQLQVTDRDGKIR
jgi:hypothetical protein